MYAVKGGWVGQIFARAASNDSGGRKSRIRRSKEERKAMVESFIKKYQKLNNGNFPSLNLTHKEVGGSFYTVREIVREIIQENRVLGPAKFSMEEQTNYNLLEQFPLGSIAVEPPARLSLSEETPVALQITPNQYDSKIEEDILHANGQPCGSEQQILLFKSEKIVNCSDVKKEVCSSEGPLGIQAISDHEQIAYAEQISSSTEQLNEPNHEELNNEEISSISIAIEEDEESDEPISVSTVPIPSHELSQEHDQETNEEQVLSSGVEYPGNGHLIFSDEEAVHEISQALEKTNDCRKPIDRMEVVEDTLDSAITQTKGLQLGVSNGRTGVKTDVLVEKFPLRAVGKTIHDFEVASSEQTSIPKTSEVKSIECNSTNTSNSMNAEEVTSLASTVIEKNSEPLAEKALMNVGDSPLRSSELSTTKETIEAQLSSLVEEKTLNVTERRIKNEKDLNSVNSSVAHGQPIPDESTASERRTNFQHDRSNKKESSSTLNRVNLETWEKKPAGPESNPLLALFKAFVAAFVKFWTE